jgi:hypothetical protein
MGMRMAYVASFYHPIIGCVEEVAKKIAEYLASKSEV